MLGRRKAALPDFLDIQRNTGGGLRTDLGETFNVARAEVVNAEGVGDDEHLAVRIAPGGDADGGNRQTLADDPTDALRDRFQHDELRPRLLQSHTLLQQSDGIPRRARLHFLLVVDLRIETQMAAHVDAALAHHTHRLRLEPLELYAVGTEGPKAKRVAKGSLRRVARPVRQIGEQIGAAARQSASYGLEVMDHVVHRHLAFIVVPEQVRAQAVGTEHDVDSRSFLPQGRRVVGTGKHDDGLATPFLGL